MSYHNGSVWPHDTAFCAMGLARYGERDGVVRMLSGLFETAGPLRDALPELFCGFPASRASRPWPIRWPACPRPGRRARPS
jgi:glycogen debranching enzyme